jgi:hypothetical protein
MWRHCKAALLLSLFLPLPAEAGDPFGQSYSSRAEPGVVQFEKSLRERGSSLWGRYSAGQDYAVFENHPVQPRTVKTPVAPNTFRVDNLGSRTIALAYEKKPNIWSEAELRPLEWKDFPCDECGEKTKITFHNGLEAQYFEVKLGQEIMIEWSQIENVWTLTTRAKDALQRVPAASAVSPSDGS